LARKDEPTADYARHRITRKEEPTPDYAQPAVDVGDPPHRSSGGPEPASEERWRCFHVTPLSARLTVLALQPRTAPISSRVRPSFFSRSASSIFSGVSAAA